MSRKQDYQILKWQGLIKQFQESGMKLKDWCTASDVTKHQYYYWLNKVRAECYEAAVGRLRSSAVPVRFQAGPFVEINPEIVDNPLEQEFLSQPMAVMQKGNIRIEIMSNASSSFISQLLTATNHA